MIASLSGKITRKAEEFIILEQGGMGFQIDMAPVKIAGLPPLGQNVTLLTHLHVRENEMSLFGFTSEEEKNLFLLVQTVSGVGPRLALQIVGSLTPDAFALAILQEDTDQLTQVKGIGKKGAARMILELTDKLKKTGVSLTPAAQEAGTLAAAPAAGLGGETLAALMVLGYSREEAVNALRLAGSREDDKVEDLLRRALSQMTVR